MVLDLLILKTDDGYTAEIPSMKGCESWAHNEDDAIEKTLELLRFYLQLKPDFKFKIDRARKEGNKVVYKVIFDKVS
ncbi:type II toxin-antitoxin system HicB family antitoxin [Melioribacter sp. OK-6-Me]|uniref:type II toxin-antitoxin system HicB family antitoxin n=1 Tax=unclassified Melioribacter TaxID=2627329 RepID=UPI003EDA729B